MLMVKRKKNEKESINIGEKMWIACQAVSDEKKSMEVCR
jgi:hypothetical protein